MGKVNAEETPPAEALAQGSTVSIQPLLRRSPRSPVYFTPVVDIRVTDRDVRLLSFVVPAADADEIEVRDGQYVLPVDSQCELILPPETCEALIQGLTLQLQRLREAQASEG